MSHWILEYRNKLIAVYVGAAVETTMNPKWAKKFETQEKAEEYLKQNKNLWMYKPTEIKEKVSHD